VVSGAVSGALSDASYLVKYLRGAVEGEDVAARNILGEVQNFGMSIMLDKNLLQRIAQIELPAYIKQRMGYDFDMSRASIAACSCMFANCGCQPDQKKRALDRNSGGAVKLVLNGVVMLGETEEKEGNLWIEIGVGQDDGKGQENVGRFMILDLDFAHKKWAHKEWALGSDLDKFSTEEQPKNNGWIARTRRTLLRTGLEYGEYDKFMGLSCKLGGKYWMRLSHIQASIHGDIGLGITFTHIADPSDEFPREAIPFPFYYLHEAALYPSKDQNSLPSSSKAPERLAITLSDGAVEAMSGKNWLPDLLKSAKTRWLLRQLAKFDAGKEVTAMIVNSLLAMLGTAPVAAIQEMPLNFYRMEEDQWKATVVAADVALQTNGLLQNLNFFKYKSPTEVQDEYDEYVSRGVAEWREDAVYTDMQSYMSLLEVNGSGGDPWSSTSGVVVRGFRSYEAGEQPKCETSNFRAMSYQLQCLPADNCFKEVLLEAEAADAADRQREVAKWEAEKKLTQEKVDFDYRQTKMDREKADFEARSKEHFGE
jgi:hypothetical protein